MLGLCPGELAVYAYLRRCENRKTHQCWPSYKTIGKAVGMSENTVSKYIGKLVDKGWISADCQSQLENVGFRRKGMSFFAGQYTGVYSLNHHITCRFEACQALIYQLALGLTGKNDMYNYSKAVHVYPPFFDITCSAKNYKIAPALTKSKLKRI